MHKGSVSFIILICLFLLLPSNTYSSSINEDYELKEKCGKTSREYFEKKHGNGIVNNEVLQTRLSFENHYYKKMNICFFLSSSNGFMKDKNGNLTERIIGKILLDVNENKTYGSFVSGSKSSVVACEVMGNICKTESEWDLLVKPYMEE